MMNTYPENDYRNYLMHWGKGKESKNHKYISRRMGKNGKWVYVYDKTIGRLAKEAKRRKALNEARDDINERLFKRYDNYLLNDKTPENFFTFISPDGEKTEAYDKSGYKVNRDSIVNRHARKKIKKSLKKKVWSPSNKKETDG